MANSKGKIYKYDLEGNFIREFESYTEAVFLDKLHKATMTFHLKGKSTHYKKNIYSKSYYIKYPDELLPKFEKINDLDITIVEEYEIVYHIYHIPNIKIGCSKNPKRRVNQQGYKEFIILETYTDIKIASERELELQEEYGYKVDYNTYSKSVQGYSIEKVKNAGTIGAKKRWAENREKELEKCSKGGKVVAEKYSKTIIQYDLDNNFIKEWKGVKQTAKLFNIKPPNLTSCLTGRQNTCGGFIWKYKY